MAKNTLNGEIAKQKRKKSFNAFKAGMQLNENAELSQVIDYMAEHEEYSQAFEAKGFTKEEVRNAAKFALQAGAYDIDVRHLDVEDSPVYYKMGNNNKLKSRGRFTRKDLDDAGKLLIARAKEVQLEQRERLRQEITGIISESGTMDLGGEIDEDQASELAEARNMEDYESGKIIDDIADNTGYLKDMDTYFEGRILKKKTGGVLYDEAHKNYMSIVDSTLNKSIPSLSSFKSQLDDRIHELMSGEFLKLRAEGRKDAEIAEALKETKRDLVSQADQKLQKYKSMYDAVRKGEMAPEVLKLFLNSALMNTRSVSEAMLYENLMKPKNMKETSPEEEKEYRDTLAELGLETHAAPNYHIRMQYAGAKFLSPQGWVKVHVRDHKISPKFHDTTGKDAVKVAIGHSQSFVHFIYQDPLLKRDKEHKTKEADKRIYITCKPGKEKLMIEAWWKTLKANKGMDKLTFKMGACPFYDRQEKIVVYVPEDKSIEDIMPYLNAFSDECAQNDVLAPKEESVITAKKLKPGITFAIEPKLKILRDKIDDGWLDKNEYQTMYRLTNPRKQHVENDFAYSYNMYVNKALMLSCCIAKKKLKLKPGDKVDAHKKELMPLVKKYFADFLKLAGADPRTMDMLPGNA